MTSRIFVVLCVLTVSIFCGLHIPGLSKPMKSRVQLLERAIGQLGKDYVLELREIAVGENSRNNQFSLSVAYGRRVKKLMSSCDSPNDLATLAIWAEKQNPWLSSSCYVYQYLFETNVLRLGKMGKPGSDNLKRIKEALSKRGHLDGHLAEVIEEAESTFRRPK